MEATITYAVGDPVRVESFAEFVEEAVQSSEFGYGLHVDFMDEFPELAERLCIVDLSVVEIRDEDGNVFTASEHFAE